MIGAASLEAEKAASTFLLSIGVEMLVWPQSQTKPDGLQNRLIYDASKIKIVKIEQVSYDEKVQQEEPVVSDNEEFPF